MRQRDQEPGKALIAIRLFGSIAVEAEDRTLGPRDFGGVKPKQVLEILLASRGHPVPKDRLADHLWSARLPQNVSGTLETYVSVLRRQLCPERAVSRQLIVTQPEAYRFATEHAWLDLDEFDRLTASIGETSNVARKDLERALELARGELLEDEPYAEWALELRDRYRERVRQTLVAASRAALAERDLDAGLRHAEEAIRLDGFLEPAYSLLMTAYYALGQRQDALNVANRCRKLFADALGTEPGSALVETERAILSGAAVSTLLPPQPIGIAPMISLEHGKLPLVGRKKELAELERGLQKALRGSFELILIGGQAGIGKTRLLDEFAPVSRGLRVGRGTCSGFETRYPYVPLAMALRDAFADLALDAEALPGLASILPELQLAGQEAEPDARTLESLVALIRSSAPLVLILDDLHLADDPTLAALDYVARRCSDVPVLVIGGFRPEEASSDSPVRRLRKTLTLELGPLTAEDLEAAGLGSHFERTGGHPRYLTALHTEPSCDELLALVSEFLVARCRAAGESAYQLLLSASILSEPFEVRTIAAITGMQEREALDVLEALSEQQVLRLDGTSFSFRRKLEREVLAASLSGPRRSFLVERAQAVGANLIDDPAALATSAETSLLADAPGSEPARAAAAPSVYFPSPTRPSLSALA